MHTLALAIVVQGGSSILLVGRWLGEGGGGELCHRAATVPTKQLQEKNKY